MMRMWTLDRPNNNVVWTKGMRMEQKEGEKTTQVKRGKLKIGKRNGWVDEYKFYSSSCKNLSPSQYVIIERIFRNKVKDKEGDCYSYRKWWVNFSCKNNITLLKYLVKYLLIGQIMWLFCEYFIQNFADITHPLEWLCPKTTLREAEESFDRNSKPLLLDYAEPFTDSSWVGGIFKTSHRWTRGRTEWRRIIYELGSNALSRGLNHLPDIMNILLEHTRTSCFTLVVQCCAVI